MIKKIIPILIVLAVIGGVLYLKRAQKPVEQKAQEKPMSEEKAAALEKGRATAEGFKRFTVNKEYFLCDIPKAWKFSKTDKRKNKKGVYGLELVGPRLNNAPTLIRVKFYLNDNIYFNGYTDFIESNSKDIFGDKKNETDTYGPVEKIKLNGKTAFRFEREIKEYADPESKSGDFVMLREKFYVIPSEKGFYILHFMVSSSAYSKYLPIFEETVYSFRGV